ncbi:MAG: class I SAM-dependent methyltransferase [Dehalococcoidia bacterium]
MNYDRCTACGSHELALFYEVNAVPVNSVLLLDSRELALQFPTSDIRLVRCNACAFVFNACFDPEMTEYSGRYESTQAFSPTFVEFTGDLAHDLIDRHKLNGKTIVEIGCGDGDFIRLLCELGNNRGFAYDPAFEPARHAGSEAVTFISDFFRDGSSLHDADLVVCKMTLEHIIDVRTFVESVRNALAEDSQAVVFFQVPNADYVFKELAFWDVYYEHCSYFTAGSLASLFSASGFQVTRTWTGYNDQYLMLEARVAAEPRTCHQPSPATATPAEISRFGAEVGAQMSGWRERLDGYQGAGRHVAVWGAGSKAVAFLAAVGNPPAIRTTVDINPNKAGTFLPGTGHEIVLPGRLCETPPDVVVAMNPVYLPEIRRDLEGLGLNPELISL